VNAVGRHRARARFSRRLNRCAPKAANETRSAKRVPKATPEQPEETEPPDGAGSCGGASGEAPPNDEPASRLASVTIWEAVGSPRAAPNRKEGALNREESAPNGENGGPRGKPRRQPEGSAHGPGRRARAARLPAARGCGSPPSRAPAAPPSPAAERAAPDHPYRQEVPPRRECRRTTLPARKTAGHRWVRQGQPAARAREASGSPAVPAARPDPQQD
jgi:hypothetical protein